MAVSGLHSAFAATIDEFQSLSDAHVLGVLSASSEFDIAAEQRDAWLSTIRILRVAFAGLDGYVALEFVVPRIGSRADVIAIVGSTIFVIEFKVGQSAALQSDRNQVWDYALDLKYFHAGSHRCPIVPILVPTEHRGSGDEPLAWDADGVSRPIVASSDRLGKLLTSISAARTASRIDGAEWLKASYQPTPTIIEAARRLYARHSVAEITRSDSGASNLSRTARTVESVIDHSSRTRQKAIVFVTGVPGAGKTLVGLDIATRRRERSDPTHAVYLSGNGPLVAVLRESLARDDAQRQLAQAGVPKRGAKKSAMHKVKAFIQNVHHFRDAGLREDSAPPEHVVIFDEAQRAWSRQKTAAFMARRKGRPGFSQSEPEFLLSYLDRHVDWSVVVCLVGGGQEINDGEAGISAWLEAVESRFPLWRVFVSEQLAGTEYRASETLQRLASRGQVEPAPGLHLATSMRSFRAERLSSFVKCVLDLECDEARRQLAEIGDRYPIRVTRDLSAAKSWLRSKARGSESIGLVASSKAQRLKPHAIDVRIDVDPIHWFLGNRSDTRSCHFLEDAATEFQVQGLELDWVCVNWDADLRFGDGHWEHFSFRGKKWQQVKKNENRRYLLNAYRVLLTRARQGLVIFVPSGSCSDQTRDPSFYDGTYELLLRSGVPSL
ncbi:MAG: DUF2075 domain-containing protein [Phycisphaerales bacterium]|nr:DUF2075 domain-containing protein [Phycisphaerales bacterium]